MMYNNDQTDKVFSEDIINQGNPGTETHNYNTEGIDTGSSAFFPMNATGALNSNAAPPDKTFAMHGTPNTYSMPVIPNIQTTHGMPDTHYIPVAQTTHGTPDELNVPVAKTTYAMPDMHDTPVIQTTHATTNVLDMPVAQTTYAMPDTHGTPAIQTTHATHTHSTHATYAVPTASATYTTSATSAVPAIYDPIKHQHLNKGKKAGWLKVAAVVLGCAAMTIGSGFIGAKITEGYFAPMLDNDTARLSYSISDASSTNENSGLIGGANSSRNDASRNNGDERGANTGGGGESFRNSGDGPGNVGEDANGNSGGNSSGDLGGGSVNSAAGNNTGDLAGGSGEAGTDAGTGTDTGTGTGAGSGTGTGTNSDAGTDASTGAGSGAGNGASNGNNGESMPNEGKSSSGGNVDATSSINGSGGLSLTDLFIGANPAVVAISSEMTNRNIFGREVTLPAAGSGFIISEDGYIVTNNHVIEQVKNIRALLHDGTEYSAKLVGRDPNSDLAVLKIEANNLSFLTWGDSGALKVGEQIVAIGNPLGEFANSMTVGYISALDREINIDGTPRNMLQTDAAVNEGNSGGPLINMNGQVVGIVTAKSSGINVEGLGFAIPSNVAENLVRLLVADGYIKGRAVMGVIVGEMEDEDNGEIRVYVESVNSGSAAEKAGVKSDDIILSANGIDVSTVTELKEVIAKLSPGDKLDLKILRGRQEIQLTITLDEYMPPDVEILAPQDDLAPRRRNEGDTIPVPRQRNESGEEPRQRNEDDQAVPFPRGLIPEIEGAFPFDFGF